jgi:hypothetical protein
MFKPVRLIRILLPVLLEGDNGDDALESNGDATQDQSTCGAGGDTAYADKIDSVAPDCETVIRG